VFGPQFVPFPERLTNVGWITTARFTAEPKREVLSYIIQHLHDDFGELHAGTMELSKASNREHIGAIKIW
jgi:hypothetical protein